MFEIKVNSYAEREQLFALLAENGYTVKLEKKQLADEFLKYDYFVVVLDEPELPKYIK